MNTKLGRRTLLKTIARAGLSAGLLKSSALVSGMMMGRTAAAINNGGINKVVFVYIPGGAPFENNKSLFTPSANLVLPKSCAAMEPVKNECVFFNDAIVTGGGGHFNTSKCLGGSVRNNSYDVELERSLGADTPFPSLLLGVESAMEGFFSGSSATKKDRQELPYQDDPQTVFNRLFRDNVNPGLLAAQRAQSVLDLQKAEINELQKVLGHAEKHRLDEHLSSIKKMEDRLIKQQTPLPGCTNPTMDDHRSEGDSFARNCKLQTDLAVIALRCNYTRVISMMFGNESSEHIFNVDNEDMNYHGSIHSFFDLDQFKKTRNYLSGQLTYLIQQLKSTTDEMGNSMLDSTLVVQVTDMADGNSHTSDEAPMLLAGGGSNINRGQVTSCGEHVNIFDTVTEALGLTGQVPRYGTGPITGVIA